ncbi:LOW QUALITY PROTEIN: exonuclease V [Pimephales promelas]|uniref:LOW QUALITY PROTEIN: exonuclease V n=1 Tax=Pimephales promelas TaxID=90988 RepID=UPI001955BEC1|nr:LOW QUALITY PROTEIN: exonuclease V [Pimephales promelas]
MDASGSQQLLDEWDNVISDSEFLNIPCEQQTIDPHRPLSRETDCEHSVDFNSPITPTSSVYNHNKETLGQEAVKTDDARGLKRKSLHENSLSPMQRFLKRHLSVTLLCDQSWCEMKTVYSLLKPHLKRKDLQRSEVQTGAEIHLSRELEIQNVVPIDIRTREDAEAIKLLNMSHMISRLETGERVREFPVFGVLEGVFFMGVIDELMYNQKGELVLNELKTRKHNSMPSSAQDKVNCLQVGLYKLLFDGVVRGEVKKDHILNHLKLRSTQVLGAGVQAHAKSIGVQVTTFEELVDALLITVSCSDLPCIDLLQLEYYHQGSSGPIGTRVAPFNEAQLRAELQGYLAYWTGQREPKGVDIEEAWKCRSCLYEQTCDWKKNRLQVSDQQAAHASSCS